MRASVIGMERSRRFELTPEPQRTKWILGISAYYRWTARPTSCATARYLRPPGRSISRTRSTNNHTVGNTNCGRWKNYPCPQGFAP